MIVEIKIFQKKLADICKLAAECGQTLTAEQLKDFLEELQPDKQQLVQVLKYFKLQGITIEGLEIQEAEEEAKSEELVLTEEEQQYIREYRSCLKKGFEPVRASVLFRAMAAGDTNAKK